MEALSYRPQCLFNDSVVKRRKGCQTNLESCIAQISSLAPAANSQIMAHRRCVLVHPNHVLSTFTLHRRDGFLNKRSGRVSTGWNASDVSTAFTDGNTDSSGDNEQNGWARNAVAFGEFLSLCFPLWVFMACILGLWKPEAFTWVDGRLSVLGIQLSMLGMGMTLTPMDFMAAFAMPKELLAGVILQYTIMPSAGYLISRLVKLPSHYAAGLILVACCPGGTASNIVTYLARGNVALSVLMTAASTFMAVVMTPFLTAKLVGQYVAVDGFSLFLSTVQVVLLPVVAGALMTQYFPKVVQKLSLISPPVAVLAVALVCAGAVSRSATAILSSGGSAVLAVMALHAVGFSCGYIFPRVLGFEESTLRTISIEVGMQNSVLGVVLAGQHFSNPLTAVPGAISSVCHSVFGSTLAGIWRLFPTKEGAPSEF